MLYVLYRYHLFIDLVIHEIVKKKRENKHSVGVSYLHRIEIRLSNKNKMDVKFMHLSFHYFHFDHFHAMKTSFSKGKSEEHRV